MVTCWWNHTSSSINFLYCDPLAINDLLSHTTISCLVVFFLLHSSRLFAHFLHGLYGLDGCWATNYIIVDLFSTYLEHMKLLFVPSLYSCFLKENKYVYIDIYKGWLSFGYNLYLWRFHGFNLKVRSSPPSYNVLQICVCVCVCVWGGILRHESNQCRHHKL